jgi:ketosteroid isomerase-like protein
MEQKWTKAEKEIWKTVHGYWSAPSIDELMVYWHPDFMGWNVNEPMPHDSTMARLMLTNELNNRKTLVTKIAPTGLKIHDDVAIVNYHYTVLYEDPDGDQEIEQGRFTDILKKDNGKWLLIADHGGANTPIDD